MGLWVAVIAARLQLEGIRTTQAVFMGVKDSFFDSSSFFPLFFLSQVFESVFDFDLV